uniref:G-protein coupled receptors family 1 profile domain-containing protein n=1 Tax=Strongyloides stercoralis TaxID=6248 RepID=A0A0K0EL23_STRER
MNVSIVEAILSIASIFSCFHIFWIECRKNKLDINYRITWANLGISYFFISMGTLIISFNEVITNDHVTSTGYTIGYILKTFGSRVNRFAFLIIAIERIISTLFFRHYSSNTFKHIGWLFSLLSTVLGLLWFLSTEFKIMPSGIKNDMHLIILVPTIFIFFLVFILNYKFRKHFLDAKLKEKYQITQNKEMSLKILPLISVALCLQLLGNVTTRAIAAALYDNVYSKFEVETIYYSLSNLQLPILSIITLLIFDQYIIKLCPCIYKKNNIKPKSITKEHEKEIYFSSYKKAWN